MRRTALGLWLALAACGGEREAVQEWSRENHAQPERSDVDPARVPRPPPSERPEVEGDPRQRAAAALWNVSCAACHGRGGAGDGPQAPGAVPDLRDAEWQSATSNEDIARVITLGRNMMPPFGDQISAEGIAALVEHVRSLGAPVEPGPDEGEPTAADGRAEGDSTDADPAEEPAADEGDATDADAPAEGPEATGDVDPG